MGFATANLAWEAKLIPPDGVYAAVAEHGGTVAIDSAPGRGTMVTVELPVHREAA
jgi:FAD synthase